MLDKDDKLKDINNNLDENITPYYTDVYSPGETKEQLVVGEEVAKIGEFSGTIDTATITTTTDNIYSLSVANPDGKIFSIGINSFGFSDNKTFKIGFFGNTSLAYLTLETELKNWLGDEFIINYVSGTNYDIKRLDKQQITKTTPNLVRDITISNWDNLTTKLDIIVDGVTVTLEGTLGGATPADYLKSQLSSSIYYMNADSSTVLTIARKDSSIPVITKTTYNRYTYLVKSVKNDSTGNTSSSNLGGTGGTAKVKIYEYKTTIDGTDYAHIVSSGLTFSQIVYNYTATNIANVSEPNEFSTGSVMLDIMYSGLGGGYILGVINGPYGTFNNQYDFTYNRTNFAQSTASYSNRYVLDSGLSLVNYNPFALNITETNNLANINVTTHTEISITLSITSNNYFIPVKLRYSKIKVTAVSSVGTSEGVYELRKQSCTSNPGTPIFIDGKIFQTDPSNFGQVTELKRGGFVLSFTTNTSNKINYTCT